jgi:hypothetical protein
VDDNISDILLTCNSVNDRVTNNLKIYIFNSSPSPATFPLSALRCRSPNGKVVNYILTLGNAGTYFHAFIDDSDDSYYGASSSSWIYAYQPYDRPEVMSVQLDPQLVRDFEKKMVEKKALGKHSTIPLQFYLSMCARITYYCNGEDTEFRHRKDGRPYFPFGFFSNECGNNDWEV